MCVRVAADSLVLFLRVLGLLLFFKKKGGGLGLLGFWVI